MSFEEKFTYEVKYSKFQIGKEGEMEFVTTIDLYAPSNRFKHQVANIEGTVSRAFVEAAKGGKEKEKTPDNDDEEDKGFTLDEKGYELFIMAIAGFCDLSECLDKFGSILIESKEQYKTALLNGHAHMNQPNFLKIGYQDTKLMFAEYCLRFLFRTLVKN